MIECFILSSGKKTSGFAESWSRVNSQLKVLTNMDSFSTSSPDVFLNDVIKLCTDLL